MIIVWRKTWLPAMRLRVRLAVRVLAADPSLRVTMRANALLGEACEVGECSVGRGAGRSDRGRRGPLNVGEPPLGQPQVLPLVTHLSWCKTAQQAVAGPA